LQQAQNSAINLINRNFFHKISNNSKLFVFEHKSTSLFKQIL